MDIMRIPVNVMLLFVQCLSCLVSWILLQKEFTVSAASTRLLTQKRFLAPECSHVNLYSCIQFIFLCDLLKSCVWCVCVWCVCVCVWVEGGGFTYKMEESRVQALHNLLMCFSFSRDL